MLFIKYIALPVSFVMVPLICLSMLYTHTQEREKQAFNAGAAMVTTAVVSERKTINEDNALKWWLDSNDMSVVRKRLCGK